MTDTKINLALEFALLALLAVLWGSSYLLIKIAVDTIPPVTLVAARVSVAAVFLLAIVAWQLLGSLAERLNKKQKGQSLKDLAEQRRRQVAARSTASGADDLVARRRAQLQELRAATRRPGCCNATSPRCHSSNTRSSATCSGRACSSGPTPL